MKRCRVQIPDPAGTKYLGFAKSTLQSLEAQRKLLPYGIPLHDWSLVDGFTIFVKCAEMENLIRIIKGGVSGFIFHPSSDTYPNGLDGKDTPLVEGPYVYPLVDNDNGSRVLFQKDGGWSLIKSPPDYYGNIDWSGDGGIVSWRGPAGRHFEMDSLIPYPGFTSWDYTVFNGFIEIEHYTPYSNFIYRQGNVAKEFLYGYKVLGAALKDGKTVAIIGVDYAGKENPDGSLNGFYDEVWLGSDRIGYQCSSRPDTPWFFSSSGLQAVHGNQLLTIANNLASVAFSDLEAGSGTQINEYQGALDGLWGIKKNGSWPMYRDFMGDVLVGINLLVSYDENSSTVGGTTAVYGDLNVLLSGSPPTTITVSGDDAAVVGSQYTYAISGGTGAMCSGATVTWSFSGGTISESGQILTITGCGTATVTATLDSDFTVLSGSKQVRLPTGVWVQVSYENYEPGHEIGPYTECVVGVRRYLDEDTGSILNVSIGGAMRWNAIMNQCIWIPSGEYASDLGFPSDRVPPVCRSSVKEVLIVDEGTPCEARFNSYRYSRSRYTYEWQCP